MIAFLVHGNAFDALRLPVSDLPLSVFFLTSLSIFLCAKKLMKGINAHRTERNFIYDMKLTVRDKSKILRGLVDTGNTVRAERDVIFISSSAALDMMGMEFAKFLTEKNASSIIVHTAIGDKKIILLPGQIELYLAEDEHIFIDVQVGIGNIKNNNEYEAILPLSVLDKEKAL